MPRHVLSYSQDTSLCPLLCFLLLYCLTYILKIPLFAHYYVSFFYIVSHIYSRYLSLPTIMFPSFILSHIYYTCCSSSERDSKGWRDLQGSCQERARRGERQHQPQPGRVSSSRPAHIYSLYELHQSGQSMGAYLFDVLGGIKM